MSDPGSQEDVAEAIGITLPVGYVVAVINRYPGCVGPLGKKLGYEFSAILLNEQTVDMPRGTGSSAVEAVQDAVRFCGGDDGLSAMFRSVLRPEGNC